MNFVDIIMYTFFVGMLGIFFAKLWNLMNDVKLYSHRMVMMGFIGSLLCWAIMFVSVMAQVGDALLALTATSYMQIVSFLLVLNTMLSIAEAFLLYRNITVQKVPYRQRKMGRRM